MRIHSGLTPDLAAAFCARAFQAEEIRRVVDDADSCWSRALAAGATEIMLFAGQYWGDRYGELQFPFRHHWSIGSPIKAVR